MAKAPKEPKATHYKFRVKAPVLVAGTNFNPGPTFYTVKAKIYDESADLQAVAIDVTSQIKE